MTGYTSVVSTKALQASFHPAKTGGGKYLQKYVQLRFGAAGLFGICAIEGLVLPLKERSRATFES